MVMDQLQATTKLPEIKACATCEHLKGRRDIPQDWEVWQCFQAAGDINLVSGLRHYGNCFAMRSSTNPAECGPQGKWYKLYERPSEYHAANPSLADSL